jgi:radical SAM protein with 4Fe4S-binding SPASM domain
MANIIYRSSTKSVLVDDELFGHTWVKDQPSYDSNEFDLEGRYCSNFYHWIEVHGDGSCFMCCATWLPYKIGNLFENSLEEIWNSKKAQTLRNQMFTNEWKYCQKSLCPKIMQGSLPKISEVVNSQGDKYTQFERDLLKNKSVVADKLPSHVNFVNDKSCNLYCPSCRVEKILNTSGPAYEASKLLNDKITDAYFTGPTDKYFSFFVTGSGDPFASKIYRDMLTSIDGKDYPNLSIGLQTNGVMFTPKMWQSLHKIHNNLSTCRISIDAGTKDTYENKVRLGGKWDVLLENLAYLNEQQKKHPKFKVGFDFVVQYDNYKEMPIYAEMMLTKFSKCTDVSFSILSDWHTWDGETYNQKCIWKETHPEYEEFLKVLKAPILNHSKVRLQNLQKIREKAIKK